MATDKDFEVFRSPGGPLKSPIEGPLTLASVAAGPLAAPQALISFVSGALAINGITLPWPGFTGIIILVPLGAFTGTTGFVSTPAIGGIANAFTAVVGKPLTLVYVGSTGLWYPSY